MAHGSTAHEVLAVVFQVRGLGPGPMTQKPELSVLLWQRAQDPERGAWSLPGGQLRHDEDMRKSVRRQLAEKVDLREVAHLEQLAGFSEPDRLDVPRPGPLPRHPGAAIRYPLAPGHRLATDGVRPRPNGRSRANPPGRQDVLYQHRIRLGSNRIRHVDAA